VSLTAMAGKAFAARIGRKGRALDERLASFGDDDLDTLAALLDRVNAPR